MMGRTILGGGEIGGKGEGEGKYYVTPLLPIHTSTLPHTYVVACSSARPPAESYARALPKARGRRGGKARAGISYKE